MDDLTREQRQSLWLHIAVAGHLVADPGCVLQTARDNIERWRALHRSDGRTVQTLDEWADILDRGADAVMATITDPGPEACELRVSSPFAGVLTEAERQAVLAAFRQTHL